MNENSSIALSLKDLRQEKILQNPIADWQWGTTNRHSHWPADLQFTAHPLQVDIGHISARSHRGLHRSIWLFYSLGKSNSESDSILRSLIITMGKFQLPFYTLGTVRRSKASSYVIIFVDWPTILRNSQTSITGKSTQLWQCYEIVLI